MFGTRSFGGPVSDLCLDASHLKLGLLLQSISSPGSGIWSDGKDKNDVSQPHTWNVEVFIDIVKEVVSELALILILTLPENRGYLVTIPCVFHLCFMYSCVFSVCSRIPVSTSKR